MSATDLTVANTILAQLGGSRFVVMTGAKHLVGDKNALNFQLGRGAKDGINCVRITLDADDTYTVRFARLGRAPNFKFTVVSELSGIYNDQLQEIFTRATGFYTSL